MKHLLLFFISFLGVSSMSLAQNSGTETLKNTKDIRRYVKKNIATIIPGTVLIAPPLNPQSYSMKQTEVTLAEWIQFIINNKFNPLYFPDTLEVSSLTSLLFNDLRKEKNLKYITIVENSKRKIKYYGDKNFKVTKELKKLIQSDTANFSLSIPIVGITYKQAIAFCSWKEDVINSYRVKKVSIKLPPKEVYVKVNLNLDSVSSRPNQQCYLYNVINCDCFSINESGNKYLIKNKFKRNTLTNAGGYWPNDLGLYGIQGNASEMTDIEGVAMGGSFMHYAIDTFRDKFQVYSKPEKWLGFRFYVTVK